MPSFFPHLVPLPIPPAHSQDDFGHPCAFVFCCGFCVCCPHPTTHALITHPLPPHTRCLLCIVWFFITHTLFHPHPHTLCLFLVPFGFPLQTPLLLCPTLTCIAPPCSHFFPTVLPPPHSSHPTPALALNVRHTPASLLHTYLWFFRPSPGIFTFRYHYRVWHVAVAQRAYTPPYVYHFYYGCWRPPPTGRRRYDSSYAGITYLPPSGSRVWILLRRLLVCVLCGRAHFRRMAFRAVCCAFLFSRRLLYRTITIRSSSTALTTFTFSRLCVPSYAAYYIPPCYYPYCARHAYATSCACAY